MSQQPTYVKPYRALGGIKADAVVEEIHDDTTIVTDLPVEFGSTVSDNAFNAPVGVILTYAWDGRNNTSNSPTYLKDLYNDFLDLKESFELLNIYTGKRAYRNMLIIGISETTDFRTENALILRITCREIILANTQTVVFTPKAQQVLPKKSAPIIPQGNVNIQPAPNYNASGGGS